jgi:RES domain-containing protein
METIYVAGDPETAIAEANPVYSIVRASDPSLSSPPGPFVTTSIRVHLDSVLDLTDPDIQSALQTNVMELTANWRKIQNLGRIPATQALGMAVHATGLYQAIYYPSKRAPGHACLAVFCDHLVAPAFMEVYDPDQNIRERIP